MQNPQTCIRSLSVAWLWIYERWQWMICYALINTLGWFVISVYLHKFAAKETTSGDNHTAICTSKQALFTYNSFAVTQCVHYVSIQWYELCDWSIGAPYLLHVFLYWGRFAARVYAAVEGFCVIIVIFIDSYSRVWQICPLPLPPPYKCLLCRFVYLF